MSASIFHDLCLFDGRSPTLTMLYLELPSRFSATIFPRQLWMLLFEHAMVENIAVENPIPFASVAGKQIFDKAATMVSRLQSTTRSLTGPFPALGSRDRLFATKGEDMITSLLIIRVGILYKTPCLLCPDIPNLP